MTPISLSLFFPAYNEEENIAAAVAAAKKAVAGITDDYEIIVINDGSRDRTGAIADALAAADVHIKVVHHNPNQGYGGAVWSGIQAATKEYVYFTDADLQFDLGEIGNLVQYVPEYDVVIGYRAIRRDPFMRLANAKGWNILNRFLFGLRVRDIDCAFKLFRREAVADLPVVSRGAMLSAELLIRLSRDGYRFKEVPVTHLPRVAGSPTGAKPSVIARAFREMASIYARELGDKRHVMLAKFLLLGTLNTAIDWLWYVALTRSFPVFASHLVAAKAAAFLVGSIPIFLTNAHWVFPESHRASASDIGKLYAIIACAFFINILALSAFLSAGIPDIGAVVLATAASFLWNLAVAWTFVIRDITSRVSRLQNI